MQNGWEIKSFNKNSLFEVIFWEEGERTIEFTLTSSQFDELKHAIIDIT